MVVVAAAWETNGETCVENAGPWLKAFGRRRRSVPRHGLLSDTASVHTFILSSETQGPSDLVWVSFFPSPGPVWERSRGWKPSLRSVSGLQVQMLEGSQGTSGQHKCLHSGTRSQGWTIWHPRPPLLWQ